MDDKGTTQILEAVSSGEAQAAAAPAPPPYLILLSGGIPGAMIRLAPGGNRLGRSDDNALRLGDPGISRRHALVEIGPDGTAARVVDLGSTNGTFLDGQRLNPFLPVPLREGDRLRLATATVLKFARPDPDEERFQREMFERTVRDGLTGLYNRAYADQQLAGLVAHAARRGLGLAVLLLDLDHFKRVNDTYGHAAGDAVLREVAAVLRLATRAEDLVARYGGEEFLVGLPAASAEAAVARAEALRRELRARRLRVNGSALHVTASMGVAFSPAANPRSAGSLLTAADFLLYRAKAAGRDRVLGESLKVPPVIAAAGGWRAPPEAGGSDLADAVTRVREP